MKQDRWGLRLAEIRDRCQTFLTSGSVKPWLAFKLNRTKQQEMPNSSRQEEEEEQRRGALCVAISWGGIERDENRTNNLFWSPEFVWVWNKYWTFVSRLYSAAWTRVSGSSVGNGEAHLYTHTRTHSQDPENGYKLRAGGSWQQTVLLLWCCCSISVVLVQCCCYVSIVLL